MPVEEAGLPQALRPEFVGEVRREGGQIGTNSAIASSSAAERARRCKCVRDFVHGVGPLHQAGDGGVEAEVLQVVGDAGDGLVRLAAQRLFAVGQAVQSAAPVGRVAGPYWATSV